MGQIFHSVVYDENAMECCVYDVDKFHANCYSHSGAVVAAHYLLRKKPYRVMWGGGYVAIHDNLDDFERREDLLGISAYCNYGNFERNNEDIEQKKWLGKAQFIGEQSKLWKKLDVWDEAKDYFDWNKTHSVKYSGFLVNHDKKLYVDLADYYEKSKGAYQNGGIMAIDLIPVLTETGGGTPMALFDGAYIETTEQYVGDWCGDLLQILDEKPSGYKILECCFAEIWQRANYLYDTLGTDKDNFLLADKKGTKYQVVSFDVSFKRRSAQYIKVEKTEKGVRYIGEFVEKPQS